MRGMGISNPLFFIGVVEDNNDPSFQGRIRVRAFGVHGTHSEVPVQSLPWAMCVSGAYTADDPLPPLNSFVFGMFLDGDEAQNPLVLGMIPTQYYEAMNPNLDGYGVIPDKDGDILAKGFTPEDIGEHQRSKVGRAERIDNTFHNQISTNALQNQKVGGTEDTWDQPSSAYSAKYPYNRVIETARHTIELDDTPGGERISIHHTSGSFIQIDAKGTTTERAEGDRYEINIGTKHESSGHSVVTVNGNAHVYVKGNKTEEIMGNYKLMVHGNSEFNTGQNSFVHAGNSLQMRGGNLKLEANADILTIFGKEEVQIEAEKQINSVSANIKNTALMNYDCYANKNIKFTTLMDFHAQASNMVLTATGLIPSSPLSGTIPLATGFSLTTPQVSILSAFGSFSGIWNAATLNGGIVSGTTGNFATCNATILAAPPPISAAPGSPCAPGPGRLTTPAAMPTLPVLTPPSQSLLVVPPLNVGISSGYAYPSPNGDIAAFFAGVLTSPFAALGVPNPLGIGGYGISRVQAPEPVSAATSIVEGGYFNTGSAGGWSSPPADTAKNDGQTYPLIGAITSAFENIFGGNEEEPVAAGFDANGAIIVTQPEYDANGQIIES